MKRYVISYRYVIKNSKFGMFSVEIKKRCVKFKFYLLKDDKFRP